MQSRVQLPRRLLRDLALRSALFWFGVRCFLTVAAVLGLPTLHPLTMGMSAGTIALVGFALVTDVRVCREAVLLGNLGVSRAQILAVSVGVSSLAESAVHLIAALA
jgi:hypothetical protein